MTAGRIGVVTKVVAAPIEPTGVSPRRLLVGAQVGVPAALLALRLLGQAYPYALSWSMFA